MEVQKYKRLEDSTIVEAAQLTSEDSIQIAQWCNGHLVNEIDPFNSENVFAGINVPTMLGNRRCSVGDYIVRDELSWFSVIARYEFEHTFEPKRS